MGDGEDTEITLGTGKLLAMFFGLVVVCAVFFGLGYSLGRSNANQAAAISSEAAPQPVPSSTAAKPTAVRPPAQPPAEGNAPGSDELTFYKSVEQKDANPQLPAANPAANGPAAAQSASAPAAAAPELTKATASGYIVQVAAVSKKEDADILFGALQKKQYPVFVTTVESDRLFHVQVGPFSDQKEAELMKAKLTADGYSPILKR